MVDEVTSSLAPLREALCADATYNKKDASSGVFFILLFSVNLQQLIAEDPGGDQ